MTAQPLVIGVGGSEIGSVPRAIGSPKPILTEVLRLLDADPPRDVLDVPTGYGVLVPSLLRRGYRVSAADIRPDVFAVPDLVCQRANLNDRLPYPSERFDAVVCCNGLHRVYALGRAVSELARVLRPGGRLLVSLPNFASLKRRVHFLMRGTVAPSFVHKAARVDEPEEVFRVPVSLAELMTALGGAGLHVRSARGLRRSPRRFRPFRVFYLPLFFPIQLASLVTRRRTRVSLHLRRTSSYELLMNDFVVIEAAKPSSE